MKWILALVLVSTQALAVDINFDRAGTIYEDQMDGRVSVYCRDGNVNRSQIYNCYSSVLRGGNYAKLVVTNGSIDADYVKLQTVGSKYIKGAKFNSETGISKGSFNLWVGSLFQRPMLDRGLNTIKYKFFKNKKLVSEGTFDVNVASGEDRYCGWGSMSYGSCPSSYQACDDYFYRNNYCRE